MAAIAERCVLAGANRTRLLQRQDWYVSGAALADSVRWDTQSLEAATFLVSSMVGLCDKGVSVVDRIGFSGPVAYHVELLS